MSYVHLETGDAKSPDSPLVPSDRLVDTQAVRIEVEAILDRMGQALDNAKITAESSTRFAVEILSGTVRHSTVLLCTLVDEVRVAEVDLGKLHERQAARQTAIIRALRFWAVATMTVNLLCIGALATLVWRSQRQQPSLVIDFEAGGQGVVHCGTGARDPTGDYHCTMDVILKKSARGR